MTRIHRPVINKIVEILKADSRVVAAWLEGSIARGEDDDFSDIDLWVAVKDTKFKSFIEDREKFAAQIGPTVSILYPKTIDQPEDLDSFQIIFDELPASMALDVEVQKESRKFHFTKDSAAEECEVLFDKANLIKHRPFNPVEVEEYARTVFEDVSHRFWHLLPRLRVAVERKDYVEALNMYMERLEDFVTLNRLILTPEKVDWGFKDLEYDLPEEVVNEVYDLWPPSKPEAIFKAAQKLAQRFLKTSKKVAGKLRQTLPEELIKKVLGEI